MDAPIEPGLTNVTTDLTTEDQIRGEADVEMQSSDRVERVGRHARH